MNERVSAKNRTSATPPVANQASSPLLHQSSLTDELSESVGSNSNISKESAGIQPKTIRRSLNWQNISVEAPSRSDGMSLPGGIQRQQEEAGTVIGSRVLGDSAQKSALESSNSTISTEDPAQKPSIARASLNRRNIPIEAPASSSASSTYSGGIQRQETSDVKKQEESTESLQMQPDEEIQAKSNEGETQEKEEQNKELVQTKLTVGAPGDKHEQEADSMAGKVMAMPDEAVEQPIQRQTEKQEQLQIPPEEEIQASSSSGEPQEKEEQTKESVQTKLTVGAPGDKYEQEADSMAAKVMRMPDSAIQQPIQRQTGEETEAVQMQPLVNSITPLVQRSSGEQEEVQMKSGAGRASDGSSQASGSLENRLAGSKGGGSPLPNDVRSFMESRFGADFSSVRVHTDSAAVQMTKELGAQAFAHGSDIYYGAGKSPGKDELTAHELTHTVQQGGAARMNKKEWRKPQLEKEEKEPVQAKEIPDCPNQLNLNKELRLKLDRPPETKNIEAKQFPNQTSEITENKSPTSDFLPEKTEQKPLETKQFTSKDSAGKPTPDTPKSSQTAVKTAPQKTQLTGGKTAGTETAPKITGVKKAAEAAPKPTVAENSPKPGAAAQQPPQQATPTPQNQPANGKAPEAGAETALGSNTDKQSDSPAAQDSLRKQPVMKRPPQRWNQVLVRVTLAVKWKGDKAK